MLALHETPSYRVLVVDDLPEERLATLAAIQAVLPTCEVVEAGSLPEANQILREQPYPFDLVVVDLFLGQEAEGLLLLGSDNAIFRRHSETRVIVWTAHPGLESACAAYEAGADAYIDKRAENSTERFQQKAVECLEQRELRQKLAREYEAQRAAREALQTHEKEWGRKYGGKFVLVSKGEVLAAHTNPVRLTEELRRYTTEEQAQMGIVAVPVSGENDGED